MKREIDDRGAHRVNETGVRQCASFLEEIAAHVRPDGVLNDQLTRELTDDLLAAWLEGTEEERRAAQRLLQARPRSRSGLDALRGKLARLERERPHVLEPVIQRDGEAFATASLPPAPATAIVHGILPGHWTL